MGESKTSILEAGRMFKRVLNTAGNNSRPRQPQAVGLRDGNLLTEKVSSRCFLACFFNEEILENEIIHLTF